MEKYLSEDIEKAIAKMFYSYLKEEKIADYDFVRICIILISKYKKLEGYIERLDFSDIKSPASYNFKTKKITVNYEFINMLYNKYKDIFLVNAAILNYVIHETVHAYQHKNVLYKDDLDSKLMKASFDFNASHLSEDDKKEKYIDDYLYTVYFKGYRRLYDEYYYTFPSERQAYFYSIMEKNEILKNIPCEDSSRIIMQDLKYLFLKLNDDYDLIKKKSAFDSPIAKFIDLHDQISYFEPIKDKCFNNANRQNISLIKRFVYGYPINARENIKIMDAFTKKTR